jgi:protein ImuA
MIVSALEKQGVLRRGLQSCATHASFPYGLGQRGVHEVAEARFGDLAAVTGFALAASRQVTGPILWISRQTLQMEHGITTEAGFLQQQPKAGLRLLVCPKNPLLALWTIEEAVRSKAVTLVIAELEEASFTATRRLMLASEQTGVPVILLMPHTREGSSAAEARWRVSARRSGPNIYDPRAPGKARWQVVLERSRSAPGQIGRVQEWEYDDETLSLHLVPALAPGPLGARPSPVRYSGAERQAMGG